MRYLYIVYTSVVSIIVLFFLSKLNGNKQMSELNMFDYINGITIGSIAAETATSLDHNFTLPLTAMIVYGAITYLISIICIKSMKARRFITGTSILLIESGKIFEKNLTKARLDINEFLAQLRSQGYFSIDDIACAYMEPNGSISVLPKEYVRPVNPQDLKLAPKQTKPAIVLIIDGNFLEKNLKAASVDKNRILKEAKAMGAENPKDILLASVDSDDKISIYLKNHYKPDNDIFQ